MNSARMWVSEVKKRKKSQGTISMPLIDSEVRSCKLGKKNEDDRKKSTSTTTVTIN